MKTFFLIVLSALAGFCTNLSAQDNSHKHLLKGDKAYKGQDYESAELQYRRALEKQNSTQGTFNLGNSTYRQERFDEAVSHYEAATASAKDDATKARAFHNLGNAHFQAGQYKESVEAFKNALRLDPKDVGTKQNLLRAIRKLPPPPPPSQQPQQGDQQNDKEKQEQNQQQQQQDQPKQEQEQNDPSQQTQQQDPNQPSEQQPQNPSNMSKEEATKLLEIMDQEEQKVQEKMRKAGAKKVRAKDW